MTLYLFFLSLTQGVSEFLPISSTAHLHILSTVFNMPAPDQTLSVALHLGTLIAIIYIFKNDLLKIITAWLQYITQKPHDKNDFNHGLCLVIATLPAMVLGLFLKKIIGDIHHTLFILGLASIVFGALMLMTDFYNPTNKKIIDKKSAILIGFFQIFAFIPGASRLGTCLTMARFLSIDRKTAFHFCLMLSIPVVLGAVTLTIYDAFKTQTPLWSMHFLYLIPFVTTIGIITGRWILKLMETVTLKGLSLYRIILGFLLIFYTL